MHFNFFSSPHPDPRQASGWQRWWELCRQETENEQLNSPFNDVMYVHD